jgi:hypothetical protein
MSQNIFIFISGKSDKTIVETLDQLNDCITFDSIKSGYLALELRDSSPPKLWEKILYPLLGLKIPDEIKSLSSLYYENSCSLLFDSESEWISQNSSVTSDENEQVRLKTLNDEDLYLPKNSFVSIHETKLAFEHFFKTKKRPSIVSQKVS